MICNFTSTPQDFPIQALIRITFYPSLFTRHVTKVTSLFCACNPSCSNLAFFKFGSWILCSIYVSMKHTIMNTGIQLESQIPSYSWFLTHSSNKLQQSEQYRQPHINNSLIMYNIIMLKSISSNGCQLLHELCHVFLQFSNVISLSLHKNHQHIRVLHIKMYSNECILAFEIVQLEQINNLEHQ